MPSMINVEVRKNAGENGINLVRRFTKRVQGAGILPRMRGLRYRSRPTSRFVSKKHRLKSLIRKEAHEELVKLGKAPERPTRYRRR